MNPVLSIVVPTLDEESSIATTLQALAPLRERGVEVILSDGGSRDATLDLAKPWVDAVLMAPRGRALQMNAAAKMARGDVLLFLHADSLLPERADGLVAAVMTQGNRWGRFDIRISGRPRMLRIVSAMMNLRSRWTGIATGDQAIFVRRDLFQQLGGFPDQPLMEDVELSRRLNRIEKPACLRQRVTASGRRWESRGVWRTIFLMWRLRWRYWRGESAHTLADAY